MDPDPGGPKTYGSYGSGSATLVVWQLKVPFISVVVSLYLICCSICHSKLVISVFISYLTYSWIIRKMCLFLAVLGIRILLFFTNVWSGLKECQLKVPCSAAGVSLYFIRCGQCCGSMEFYCGRYLWLMDPDPHPAIFVSDLQKVRIRTKMPRIPNTGSNQSATSHPDWLVCLTF